VRYVWEKLEHFFEHAERGRRTPAGKDGKPAAPAEQTANCVPVEQLEADLVKLFGKSWKARR
jgi:hypothetical protein